MATCSGGGACGNGGRCGCDEAAAEAAGVADEVVVIIMTATTAEANSYKTSLALFIYLFIYLIKVRCITKMIWTTSLANAARRYILRLPVAMEVLVVMAVDVVVVKQQPKRLV